MALKVVIETIPHCKQRYPTCGDWYIKPDGSWCIRISDMKNWIHEVCIAIHELAEMAMCMRAGISGRTVDDFDTLYEAKRQEGDTSEPGDSPLAPYYRQHGIASGLERVLATELGVDWTKYNDEVNSL